VADDDSFGFALPPFKAEEALVQLKRTLRDLKLAERSGGFELKGRRLVELAAESTHICARLVRRPALTPEWESAAQLKSAADVRRFVDELRRRLARWETED
jgi:glutamine synthetase adenylyltransferase